MYFDSSRQENFEAYDSGHGSEVFEKFSKKRRNRYSTKNERNGVSLSVPRRHIRPQDRANITAHVMEAADGQFAAAAIKSFSQGYGVSIVTPRTARRIFDRFHNIVGETGARAQRFNDDVELYVKEINRQNPTIFARLGGISIYGTRPDQHGPRYIGASIIGSSADCLAAEHLGLIREQTPEYDDTMMTQAVRFRPHISFATTGCQQEAEAIRDAIADQGGISGSWVELGRAEIKKTALQ